MGGEDAVDVRQQHQRLGLHHHRNETRQLVVIREHQLRDTHRIVLVHDRQYVVLKHHCHAGTLVTILFTGLEVLLHRKHLPDVDAVFTEEVVIESHQFHLPHRREQLPLLHRVKRVIHCQLPAPTGHSSRTH